MNNTLDIATSYTKRSWAVFPVIAGDKIPACEHGFHAASTNPWDLRKLWAGRTNLNIGVATGAKSGFWVLDIDGEVGQASLEALTAKYGSLPDTLVSKTGKGWHYLFKYVEGIRNTANKVGNGIDTRGDGGYIVVSPSVHPNGSIYSWEDEATGIADAPEWLIKTLERPEPVRSVEEYEDRDWSASDVQNMLGLLDPDCSYDNWYQIGMALQAGGWPLAMWDNWSMGGAKYITGECTKKWESFRPDAGISFGTLVYMAQINGWKPKEIERSVFSFSDVNGVNMSEFIKNLDGGIVEELPTKEIELSGLIAETVSWINSVSFKLQPELTLMNVIAALGAVFGRRYTLQKINTRTNIYLIGIAETGMGKDNSRKRIKTLMVDAGLSSFLGPDEIRSGPGLGLELKQKPSMIAHIDEIGMFMRAMFDPRAAGYLREISSMFTKLYSSSDSEYIGGQIASKPGERLTLKEPNFCLYGTTTLSSYASAMKKEAISSGEINRFIVLKSGNDFPASRRDAEYFDPPEHLVSRWAKFKPDDVIIVEDWVKPPKKMVMLGECEPKVWEMLTYQDEMIKKNHGSGLGALWVRYRENALKIAMIFAIARDSDNPVLIKSDLETGCQMVEQSINFMMKFAGENMYETPFQKNCNAFIELLRKTGEDTRTNINRSLRLNKNEMNDVVHHLQETEMIDIIRTEKSKKIIYILTGDKK